MKICLRSPILGMWDISSTSPDMFAALAPLLGRTETLMPTSRELLQDTLMLSKRKSPPEGSYQERKSPTTRVLLCWGVRRRRISSHPTARSVRRSKSIAIFLKSSVFLKRGEYQDFRTRIPRFLFRLLLHRNSFLESTTSV